MACGFSSSYAFSQDHCSSNALFGQNSCQVCHTDETLDVDYQGDSYQTSISNLEFEWTNLSDKFNELIYDDEQELPTISSNVDYRLSPEKADQFWSYGEQVLWTEYEGVNEYYTDPGTVLVFRKSKVGSSININEKSWPAAEAHILVSAPLVFREMDIESFEESDKQVRNYCVLVPLNAIEPKVVEEEEMEEDVPEEVEVEEVELESAGEEPNEQDEASEQPQVVIEETQPDPQPEPEVQLEAAAPVNITSNQTQTAAGAHHVALVAIALLG